MTCEKISRFHCSTKAGAEHTLDEKASFHLKDIAVVANPVIFRHFINAIAVLVYRDHTGPAEHNFISLLFIFSTVTDSASGVFLHGLVSLLSVDSCQPFVIEITSVITFSLIYYLAVLGVVVLPLPLLHVLEEVLLLLGGEIAIQ